MSIDPGWQVAVALAALLAITLVAHRIGRYGLERPVVIAAARALLQLAAVALLIRAVIDSLTLSFVFVAAMFCTATVTTAHRIEAPRAWAASAFAMACGVVPAVGVLLVSGAIPTTGIAIIPAAGIVIGNAMTANTLAGRRVFPALREEHSQYEAALALGMRPAHAIGLIVHRRSPEALLPGLDQVTTTGIVTLPGAFIGVLLGGGTPVQAATAQVLVLFAIMAAQTVTVVVGERLVTRRMLLPTDLRGALID